MMKIVPCVLTANRSKMKQIGVIMSQPVLEPLYSDEHHPNLSRRHTHQVPEDLILSELNPAAVIDQEARDNSAPCELITFGSMRETCPKCMDTHLKLVLRQMHVRVAHLFCAKCDSCFDAHYADGASAFSI